jgi:hypothetical protein
MGLRCLILVLLGSFLLFSCKSNSYFSLKTGEFYIKNDTSSFSIIRIYEKQNNDKRMMKLIWDTTFIPPQKHFKYSLDSLNGKYLYFLLRTTDNIENFLYITPKDWGRKKSKRFSFEIR